MFQRRIDLPRAGAGLHDVTAEVAAVVEASGVRAGLCHVFLRHTSASLLIQENADPQVQRDLEAFLARLAPEGDPLWRHTSEGPDDMPAHARAALTAVELTLPVIDGRLGLGTWQGLFLWEHRRRSGGRSLVVTVWGERGG